MNNLQTLFTDYIIQKNIFYIFLGVFSIFLTSRWHDDETKRKRSGKGYNYYNYILFCRWHSGVERRQVEFLRIGYFTCSLYDYEELVGVISGDDVVDFGGL